MTSPHQNKKTYQIFLTGNRKIIKIVKELAILAKKYLSMPASSASVERIFSISSHIFSVKQRRLHHKYFSELVFPKLNELFM